MAGGILGLDLDPDSLSQPAHGPEEVEVLVVHDKLEDVTSLAAAEAVPDLFGRINVKTRCFLLVEWAECAEVRTGAFQWKHRPNDVHHVIRMANLLDNLIRDASGHSRLYRSLNLCSGWPIAK